MTSFLKYCVMSHVFSRYPTTSFLKYLSWVTCSVDIAWHLSWNTCHLSLVTCSVDIPWHLSWNTCHLSHVQESHGIFPETLVTCHIFRNPMTSFLKYLSLVTCSVYPMPPFLEYLSLVTCSVTWQPISVTNYELFIPSFRNCMFRDKNSSWHLFWTNCHVSRTNCWFFLFTSSWLTPANKLVRYYYNRVHCKKDEKYIVTSRVRYVDI